MSKSPEKELRDLFLYWAVGCSSTKEVILLSNKIYDRFSISDSLVIFKSILLSWLRFRQGAEEDFEDPNPLIPTPVVYYFLYIINGSLSVLEGDCYIDEKSVLNNFLLSKNWNFVDSL